MRSSVISYDLRESISDGDASEYTVMVSLTNDELDTYPLQLADDTQSMQAPDRSTVDTSGTLEEIQARISEQRAQSRAFYQAQNQAIIDDAVDAEDVVYISRYSPVAILKLSPSEINQLALNSEVASIIATSSNSYNNVKISNIYSDETTTCTITITFINASAGTNYLALAWNFYS